MQKTTTLSFVALAIISSISPVVARETNELITQNKLNVDRCKEDFSTCAKISEAAKVSFGAYRKDSEKEDKDWKPRFEQELKEPGAGWDQGYQKVKTVVVKENNAEFVIAQKKVVIGTKKQGGQIKEVTKTYYLIGIRGTQGVWDMATDAAVAPDKFEGYDVHGGFKRYTESITQSDEFKEVVKDILAQKQDDPDDTYEVLVTGHSLGGASATLVKAKLENLLRSDGKESSISKISAITFGAPPVGDQKFSDDYSNRVTAIVTKNADPIPSSGFNARYVGDQYQFEHPNDTKKRQEGTSRNILDKALDSINIISGLFDWHMTYGQRDRYDSSVQNGWYDLRNNLMQNSLTSIIQGGSSHIGSAAYYLGRSSDNDPQLTEDLMTDQRIRKVERFSGASSVSRQQREEYTAAGSITNLKAPVDIVLNWIQTPERGKLDLDSHLTGPTSLGSDSSVRFHTRFDDKGSITTAPYVQLYRDVIPANGGSGDEQTRIQVLQDGVYRFYVHDYTNRYTVDSPALAQSGANVNVYTAGKELLREGENVNRDSKLGGSLNVPTDGKGNVWYTFQLDSRTGILKRVLVPFGNVQDRALVPRVGEAPSVMTLPR